MGRLVRVIPPRDTASNTPPAPVVAGAHDIVRPPRPGHTRGLAPVPLPRASVWIGFDDEGGRCALL